MTATENYELPAMDEPIKMTQLFARDGLTFLLNHRQQIDPVQFSSIESIFRNKKPAGEDSVFPVLYQLKKPTLGFGRMYGSKGSLETLKRDIRGTLCRDLYHDLDISNCHPVLLVQFAKRYFDVNLPELTIIVQNRSKFLDQFPTRDEGKVFLLTLLYGGINTTGKFLTLADEIKSFNTMLMGQPIFKDLLKYCQGKVNNEAKKGIKKSLQGVFLSLILQTEERRCMMAMVEAARRQVLQVDVLSYDGIMIRKPRFTYDIVAFEDVVRELTGYNVNIVEKEQTIFDGFVPNDDEDDGNEVTPGVSLLRYVNMKKDFEATHFFYSPTNTFVTILPNGSLIHMELKHAKAVFSTEYYFKLSDKFGDNIYFFDLWLKDTTRRVIHKIDLKPSDDPFVFSLPVMFAYKDNTEPISAEHREHVETFFKDFIQMLLPEDEIRIAFIQWLAHLIQKPFENPLMAFILIGGKGCGKDTIGDFIADWIVGSTLSQNYASNQQYWDKHDVGRANRLFIKLEEASGLLNIANSSELKARITSKDMVINPKGQTPYTCSNYNRNIMTANECNPVDMTEGERRFAFASCSPRRIGDMEYWNELRATLFNSIGGQIIGEMLEHFTGLGKWPRVPPRSILADMAIDGQQTSELKFVKQRMTDGKSYPLNELYVQYLDFCAEQKLPFCKSAPALGKRFQPLIRDNILQRNENMNRHMVYSRVDVSSAILE